jgi:hypothetical protein
LACLVRHQDVVPELTQSLRADLMAAKQFLAQR